MKLNQVLSQINQIERSKFLNCLDQIIREHKELDTGSATDIPLRDASENEITSLFYSAQSHFSDMVRDRVALLGSQTNLLLKVLSRDGNCIARVSWIEKLFLKEYDRIQTLSAKISEEIESATDCDNYDRPARLSIYKDCLKTAYNNDLRLNREPKITDDERTILITLANRLDLSADEVFAIENLVVPLQKNSVENLLETLKDAGIIFLRKRKTEVLIADEIIEILHTAQNKELQDKYAIRILRSLSDAELANVYRRHGMKARGIPRTDKIDFIIKSGMSIRSVLSRDIFGEEDQINARKDRLKAMIEDLDIETSRLGATLDDRISVIISSLKSESDKEFKSLSSSGLAEMLAELKKTEPSVEVRIRQEFEIEDAEELDTERLRAYSISPLDILYLYSNDEIKAVRDSLGLSKRGNLRSAIIDFFTSANDKYIDNYEKLAQRDIAGLKQEGIEIKEAELGNKFEDITRSMLSLLGLNVDEELRKEINSAKDKADIVLSIANDDVIVGEAKSFKNGDFAKYSSTSRQVKSYVNMYESAGKRVAQALIIAPSFSQDFIESAEMDTEINISLLEARGLKLILDAYRAKNTPKFSAKLLTKGGLLKAERIAAAI